MVDFSWAISIVVQILCLLFGLRFHPAPTIFPFIHLLI